MRDRLLAVAMTYLTRPFIWVFAGLCLVLLVAASLSSPGGLMEFGSPLMPQLLGLMFLMLSFGATSQFSLHSSHLTPRFAVAHQAVALAMLSGAVLAVTTIFVVDGYALLPSLGIVMSLAGLFVWFGYLISSYTPRASAPRGLGGVVMGGAFGLAMGGGALLPMLYSGGVERYLSGHTHTSVAIGLLITGGVAIAKWITILPDEAHRFAKAGTTTAFTWKDQQRRMTQHPSVKYGEQKQSWVTGANDRFLRTTLRRHSQDQRSSVRLRRAGTGRTFWVVMLLAILLPIFSWLFLTFILSPNSTGPIPERRLFYEAVPWLIQFVIIASAMVGGAWRQRMPALVKESLLPATRATFRREMFFSVLIDMLPIAVCSLGGLLFLLTIAPFEARAETKAVSLLCGWVLSFCTLYGFVMWVLQEPSVTKLVATGIVAYALLIGVVFAFVILNITDRPTTTTEIVSICAVAFALIGCGLVYVWRRWGTVEFGMLDR